MKLSSKIKAFTLIELLISISIFMIMTTILMGNYPKSLVRTNLFNLSNNIVILLREAQVKGSSSDSQGSTVTGYGLYFDSSVNKIIYFNDLASNSNKIYDNSPDEKISIVSILNGYYINKLSYYSGSSTSTPNNLTITFVKTYMKAYFSYTGSPSIVPVSSGSVCIELNTSKDTTLKRSIAVYSIGRIVSSGNPCP